MSVVVVVVGCCSGRSVVVVVVVVGVDDSGVKTRMVTCDKYRAE